MFVSDNLVTLYEYCSYFFVFPDTDPGFSLGGGADSLGGCGGMGTTCNFAKISKKTA